MNTTVKSNSLPQWDGKCHGCQKQIWEEYVATVGPFYICDTCKYKHFPNEKYSVNQAADILERIRGFKDVQ